MDNSAFGKLIVQLKTITGISFINIANYRNQKDELASILINIGVSYEKAKQKDIEFLNNLDITELNTDIDKALLKQAKDELLQSLNKPSENRSNAQKEAYTYITTGLKVHNDTGEIFVTGMQVRKTQIEENNTLADTRKPLTKAKDFLREQMKSTQYRQYKVGQFKQITVNKEILIFE